ncbi:hypothetical protein GJ496_009154 [Pomphorhynchus laevis]|nr:hypothetical protein GJ496_009154 [Pomphorhynchus laevis]
MYSYGLVQQFRRHVFKDFQDATLKDFQDATLKDFQDATLKDFQDATLKDFQDATLKDFQDATLNYIKHMKIKRYFNRFQVDYYMALCNYKCQMKREFLFYGRVVLISVDLNMFFSTWAFSFEFCFDLNMTENGFPTRPPTVLWAQDKTHVFLTVEALDIANPSIDITPSTFSFNGISNSSKINYKFKLDLFKEIVKEDSVSSDPKVSSRCWLIKLKKKDEDESYWERLTENKDKVHWLKIDWSRWKDEDALSNDMPSFGGYDDDYAPPDFDESNSDEDDDADISSSDDKEDEGSMEKIADPASAAANGESSQMKDQNDQGDVEDGVKKQEVSAEQSFSNECEIKSGDQ